MKATILSILALCPLLTHAQSTQLPAVVSSTIEIQDTDTRESIIYKAAHVVPTPNQYDALQNEFIAFIHFGPNTFTRMEWGSGMEDPSIFDLQTLDTDQWCAAMTAAGMKMVIITVKHHDGFCLWQSRYTKHGIMSSPFENGKGDVLKELAASCKKYDLKLGIYLSPADLYQIESADGLYGNLSPYTERTIPRRVEGRPFANKTTFKFKVDDYNEYMLNQLFELLTEYGPVHEVWFDGAHPKRKGNQQYTYLAWKELIHTLAPKAVIFGRQDVRWCGNEAGQTRPTEWNVIPYQDDPNAMNHFADLTATTLGEREQLYLGKYLHYQMAETNTSIREGWFYRDDTDQKVRSADDVYDIYERSVGGNSIFLLNIPPNRSGRFSPTDVEVLEEVGQRIRETYEKNLFAGADGPAAVLDEDDATYATLEEQDAIIVTAPEPITLNRLVLQEAVATHSERIEAHTLEAWIEGGWQEIAQATNVGYKRILRFPEITAAKFRIQVLESRLTPAITRISAHYYRTRPPQLTIERDLNGMVSIQAKQHEFRWKPHGEDIANNINRGAEIRYTLDQKNPTRSSALYAEPFLHTHGEVRAAVLTPAEIGSVATHEFGIIKMGWKLSSVSSEVVQHEATKAFDNDPGTYWCSKVSEQPYLVLDLGSAHRLQGFVYTPPGDHSSGMIETGRVEISSDGQSWTLADHFRFGNLINDPTRRKHVFGRPAKARYIKVISTSTAGSGSKACIGELDFLAR